MNAVEIIQRVQSLGAQLYVDDARLMVSGSGEPLPEELRLALKDSKVELLVALGMPLDRIVGVVLADVRPYLDKNLQQLPDSKLLVLVNWSIMHAWNRAARRLGER